MTAPACPRCAVLTVKDDALSNLTSAREERGRVTARYDEARSRAEARVERAEGQVQRAADLLDLVGNHTCEELKP